MLTDDTADDAAGVSVIVTTKDSGRTIERCLLSIRSQSFRPLELIVVDNFSEDETASIARAYANSVIVAGPERCTQRNIGVRGASGKYVFIVDSDMYLRPDVVEKCVVSLRGGNVGAIVPERSVGTGFWAECKAFERSFYEDDRVVSAARFFLRETYERVGGYDETLVSGEDWDLSMRIEGLGQLAIADTIVLHDEGALRLGTLIRKKFYYGRHIRRFFEKHGANATKKLNTLRGSYIRFCKRFFERPLLSAGMISMRVCEMAAGGAGLLLSLVKAA